MKKELICTNSIEWLTNQYTHYRMLFGDPPDGIGLKYNGFKDKISPKAYEIMLHNILMAGHACFDVIWLSVNTRWSALLGYVTHQFLKQATGWEFKACVQTFTFGQHCETDFGNNHRLLYRYRLVTENTYSDAIRVPSWRQLNGDKRANPNGRVPGDVFDFPRVTGNSKQRRKFSPTQLHEGLYERCIKSCCVPGDTVVDLFAGSGTLGRVADRCGVNALMLEVSRETCDEILKDQPETIEVRNG